MGRTSFANWPCSVARTMDLLGDWWTPLVLRDAFYGVRRFDEFQQGLGIARNTLADRLRRLVDEGLLEKQPYQTDPRLYPAGDTLDARLTTLARALDLVRSTARVST